MEIYVKSSDEDPEILRSVMLDLLGSESGEIEEGGMFGETERFFSDGLRYGDIVIHYYRDLHWDGGLLEVGLRIKHDFSKFKPVYISYKRCGSLPLTESDRYREVDQIPIIKLFKDRLEELKKDRRKKNYDFILKEIAKTVALLNRPEGEAK